MAEDLLTHWFQSNHYTPHLDFKLLMEIGYKNLLFLIPCLAVISLNLAFQPPFLAPQSHEHLEITKEKKYVGSTYPRTFPSVHRPHAIPVLQVQSCSFDDYTSRNLAKARRLEVGIQVAGFNTLTQCQMTHPTHSRRTAKLCCIARVAALKYEAHWNSFGTVTSERATQQDTKMHSNHVRGNLPRNRQQLLLNFGQLWKTKTWQVGFDR